MAVTWKQLAYQADVSTADSKAVSAASMATSEGVVRSTADSSLVVLIGTPATSANLSTELITRSTADSSLTLTVSTADSKGVSAASMATSEGVVRSTADSSLVIVAATADSKGVSAGVLASTALSTSDSADVAQSTTISTADSKGNSAGVAASTADSKAVSEGVVRSTADSSLSARTLNSWATATGPVAFGGQQATDLVVHTVATSAAITGVTPVLGKIVWDTADLSLWVNTATV